MMVIRKWQLSWEKEISSHSNQQGNQIKPPPDLPPPFVIGLSCKNPELPERIEEKKKESHIEVLEELEEVAKVPLAWWEYLPGGLKIKEYCDLSTLHGLRYFSEPGRSLVERLFWIVVLVWVYVGALVAMYDQLLLFLHAPVLTSIASRPTPMWDIPFPAVTICSENQVRPTFFNFTDYLQRASAPTPNESEILDYLSITCMHNISKNNEEHFSNDVMNHIHNEIWGHCEEMFMMRWMTHYVPRPCDWMQRVLTPNGACHTFNSLPGDQLFRPEVFSFLNSHTRHLRSQDGGIVWSPDGGFRDKNNTPYPPWRASGGGLGLDALFLMDLNYHDFDETCFFGGRGFRITLHSPAELPSPSHPSTYVSVDHFAQVKVMPSVKTTDKTLRRWSPVDRGCYFQDERPLMYFKYYTENNCDLECESNVSLALCGCVPFFHPRTKNIPICRLKKLNCYLNSIAKTMDPATGITNYCDCMPSCSEIEYSITVTSFPRNFSTGILTGLKGWKLPNNKVPGNGFAAASISYQTQKSTAMMRIAVFGLSDFVANMGGLLGLFLGFSFISLFELCYFCTLRFYRKKPNKIMISLEENKGSGSTVILY